MIASADELMALLKIDANTLSKLLNAKEGAIPHFWHDNNIFFDLDEIRMWIKNTKLGKQTIKLSVRKRLG